MRKTGDGYLVEVSFTLPDVKLRPGMVFGLDTGVVDDDGQGMKSLQLWTGNQVEFWITMDHYGQVTLAE